MFKNLQNILMLAMVLVIFVLLLQKGCGKPGPDLSPKIDSVTTHDTVWAKDTLYSFKPVYKPKYDTIYKIDTIKYEIDPLDLFFVREYRDTLDDTNQTVFTYIKTLGMLDSLGVKYKLKVPLTINNNTTITIEKPIPVQPRFSIYGGLEVGGNKSTFNLSPFINLNLKNNNVYYRYGVLDNTHSIGVGLKLYKSKK